MNEVIFKMVTQTLNCFSCKAIQINKHAFYGSICLKCVHSARVFYDLYIDSSPLKFLTMSSNRYLYGNLCKNIEIIHL